MARRIDTLTRKQLERAAQLREESTWKEVRAELRMGYIRSTEFYEAWTRAGIPHKPKRDQKPRVRRQVGDSAESRDARRV